MDSFLYPLSGTIHGAETFLVNKITKIIIIIIVWTLIIIIVTDPIFLVHFFQITWKKDPISP